jgi:hypothetical protein
VPVTTKLQETLDQAVSALRAELGDNLFSCCLYGSAVRGNSIEGVSDINLLILLNQSNAKAHEAIARAIGRQPLIDPFVLTRHGFERSEKAFATKFSSIKRNYRVVHGADPLANLKIDPSLEKFLCEQAIRNLRLRLAYSFMTRERHKTYDKFVFRSITSIFVQLSEALRLNGTTIPAAFDARVPVMEKEFKVDGQVLRDLLALKKSPRQFSDSDSVNWHERLFPVLDGVMNWIETNWPAR